MSCSVTKKKTINQLINIIQAHQNVRNVFPLIFLKTSLFGLKPKPQNDMLNNWATHTYSYLKI